jgi:hypothetical protein
MDVTFAASFLPFFFLFDLSLEKLYIFSLEQMIILKSWKIWWSRRESLLYRWRETFFQKNHAACSKSNLCRPPLVIFTIKLIFS